MAVADPGVRAEMNSHLSSARSIAVPGRLAGGSGLIREHATLSRRLLTALGGRPLRATVAREKGDHARPRDLQLKLLHAPAKQSMPERN
jgi:hypothetical protein